MRQIASCQNNLKILTPVSTEMAGRKRCRITGQMDVNRYE